MASNDEGVKLSDLFDDIWVAYQYLEESSEPTVSEKMQERVKEGIEKTGTAIFLVNELDLFSNNEELEEVATNEIKYLVLSALLSYFIGRNTTVDRKKVIKTQRGHYIDFLKLCKWYGITNVDLQQYEADDENETEPKTKTKSTAGILQTGNRRANKIERFKQKKETEKRLKELYTSVQKEHVDDEVKRDYFTTLLKSWIHTALEDLESISDEITILEHMENMKMQAQNGKSDVNKTKENQPPKTFRPFILTRNKHQSKVFGAGYASLPTYTVEEWYEQQVAAGLLPTPEQSREQMKHVTDPLTRQTEIEKQDLDKEAKLENDDPDELKKAREWDDYKDDHRRGWGNRQNMG